MIIWIKNCLLSLIGNYCLQYGDNCIVVIGDNLSERLLSKSNIFQGYKYKPQMSGVILRTISRKCRLQISSITRNNTGCKRRL